MLKAISQIFKGQETRPKEEFVKATFHGEDSVFALTPSSFLVYSGLSDPKTLLITSPVHEEKLSSADDELNDFDYRKNLVIASDLGLKVYSVSETYKLELLATLTKHENIVLKCLWSPKFDH